MQFSGISSCVVQDDCESAGGKLFSGECVLAVDVSKSESVANDNGLRLSESERKFTRYRWKMLICNHSYHSHGLSRVPENG